MNRMDGPSSPLDQLAEALLDRIADKVAKRLRETDPGMIDQRSSPLGPRRHCACVRRRLHCGLDGASIVGRRFLLTPEALAYELGRAGKTCHGSPASEGVRAAYELGRAGKRWPDPPAPEGIRATLERDLRVVRGG